MVVTETYANRRFPRSSLIESPRLRVQQRVKPQERERCSSRLHRCVQGVSAAEQLVTAATVAGGRARLVTAQLKGVGRLDERLIGVKGSA